MYSYVLLCFAYSKALLKLPEEQNITYIPGLHYNQSSIDNFCSRMRNLDRDRTNLYGCDFLQQNAMNVIHDSNNKRNRMDDK